MRETVVNKRATLYMARNIANDDFYIGVTCRKLEVRKNQHLSEAKSGKYNYYFQRAIRKYGADNFIWTKIGEMPTYQEGLDMEKELIKEMKPRYNQSAGGEGSLGVKKSPEARKKISEAQKGKKRNPPSEETRKKIGDAHRGKKYSSERKEQMSISRKDLYKKGFVHPMLGKHHSEETRKQMSIDRMGNNYNYGRKMSEYTKERLVEANKGNKYRLGQHHSTETRKKMSESNDGETFKKYAHLGPQASAKKVICLNDGRIFDSASAAAKNYGSAKSAIIELCLGKRGRKTVNGRIFKYVENL